MFLNRGQNAIQPYRHNREPIGLGPSGCARALAGRRWRLTLHPDLNIVFLNVLTLPASRPTRSSGIQRPTFF